MGQLRAALSRGKGLVAVVGYHSILFPETELDCQHLLAGGGWIAVDTGHQPLPIGDLLWQCGFLLVYCIPDNIIEVLCGGASFFIALWGRSLLWVLHIKDHFPKPALDCP